MIKKRYTVHHLCVPLFLSSTEPSTIRFFCILLFPISPYRLRFLFSISMIISTLIPCLPPANSAFSHASTMLFAVSIPITRAPNAITFALLCSFAILAVYGSLHTTARIPFTLLAASEIPAPVPHIAIPCSTSPLATAFPNFSPNSG